MDSEFSILVKYLSQPLTAQERETLLQWRAHSPENEALFSEISKLRLLSNFSHHTAAETTRALSLVQSKIRQRTRIYRFRNVLKYAAIALLILFVSLFGISRMTSGKYTTITVADDETIRKVSLSDGTTVWLGAASELRIPKSFSSKHRNVLLKGKAFFDVEKNLESPLIVTSPSMSVRVTGTSFDMSVYDGGRRVETILVSGKVVLQDNRRKNIYEMSPGEKVVYNSDVNQYTVSSVDTNTITAWHLGQITFENVTLREIVNKLGLIYDVNINLESKKLADRRYRCVINHEESLKEVLDILAYLAPISYRIEGNEVFITE